MTLSVKLIRYNAWLIVAIPYLLQPANITKFRLTVDQVNALTSYLAQWGTIYGLYADALTHTPGSITNIDNLYDILHPYMEGVKKQIQNDPNVILSGDDRTILHIPVPASHRVHVPGTSYSPAVAVLRLLHLIARLFVFNPNVGHETEIHKPTDVAKIGRKTAVVKAGDLPPTIDKYIHLDDIGTTEFNLEFTPDQVGMICYIICWYISPTGEPGPVCLAYSFPII